MGRDGGAALSPCNGGHLDPRGAPLPPPEQDPDSGLWLLTRHADVWAALCHPSVIPVGSGSGNGDLQTAAPDFGEILSPGRWARLRPYLEREAHHLVDRLPRGSPVELVESVARPWYLGVARTLLELDGDTAIQALPPARAVFRSASHSPDGSPHPEGDRGAWELAAILSRSPGPGDPAARVQAFVALTCTLPLLLAGSWLLLLEEGAAPPRHPRTLEELLRLAGPATRVFRETAAPVEWGGVSIPAGARLALGVAAANRDPGRFPDPHGMDPRRPACPHLSLGAGSHVCAGAALVRDALRLATGALFRPTLRLALVGPSDPPTWWGGAAIRGPDSLPVVVDAT